jgi:hypothetical protein
MTDKEMIDNLRRMAEIKAMTFEALSAAGFAGYTSGMEAMLLERKPEMREMILNAHAESLQGIQIEAGVLAVMADNLESGEPVPNVLIKRVVKMAKAEDDSARRATSEIEDIYEDEFESYEDYDEAKFEKEGEVESAREDAAFLRTVIKRARQTQ